MLLTLKLHAGCIFIPMLRQLACSDCYILGFFTLTNNLKINKMKQNLNTELRLENTERDDHFLRIRPDLSSHPNVESNDLVCLNIIHKDKSIDLCDEETADDGTEFFHLDKFQVGCLIDYLNRLYSLME